MGNAISDFAGIVAALGGLSAALIFTDDKEERKSRTINLGIPIIITIISSAIANAKNIAGLKGALFGLAISKVGTIIANGADSKIKQVTSKKNQKKA